MPGGRLADRYSLVRPLGSGGMGRVWLARDEMLDREVAVKELTLQENLPAKMRSDLVTRAVREAQATAMLRHPGVVALHDVIVEHERPWLVMELLRGQTLADAVRARGPMPAQQVARIGADVLEALSAAHAHGLQHRDVKPGNVFLTETGRVVLTDFGIARQEGMATITEQGLMIGSPGFIAPERLEGEPGGPAGDVWSLGATLFTAVQGYPPFDGSPADRIKATLTQPVPRAPEPLGPVLEAMMARAPAARPGAQAAIHALRQIAAGQSPFIAINRDVGRRRGRAVIWIAAAVAVVLVAAAAFFLLKPGENALPEAFTQPMNVCTLLSAQDVGGLLRTGQPPKPKPGSDDLGPKCGWELPGAGIAVQVQKDSDTPDPWSMTPRSAQTLFANQQRYWTKYDQIDWTWPEIGVKGSQQARRTPVRTIGGVGEQAFAFELTGKTGKVHTAYVFYRLTNLVVSVDYTTLATSPTDDQVRQVALQAAKQTEQALRRAG
ncbi:serine/threonine-protein kinase [Nonomuraea sediminis]|uniref:serine/threonine-protein kinase n=1 Tax=Nonomuraea sediminis TaxID=2835864 RepID=UPI001BDDBA8A|nr:serine/threonine-protein kinase [Nonomuraea sediminis]